MQMSFSTATSESSINKMLHFFGRRRKTRIYLAIDEFDKESFLMYLIGDIWMTNWKWVTIISLEGELE